MMGRLNPFHDVAFSPPDQVTLRARFQRGSRAGRKLKWGSHPQHNEGRVSELVNEERVM
jgi:hypothetical protein